MKTITIKVRDDEALQLIYQLEDLESIELVKPFVKAPAKKLSSLLIGSISQEQADKMHAELKKMRSE